MLSINVLYNERNPGIKICDRLWKRWILSMCTKVVANSKGAAAHMSTVLKREVPYINNGIKQNGFSTFEIEDKGLIFVPARITPIKNQMVVLKAINLLNKRGNNFKIQFAGTIEDEAYYNQLMSFVSSKKMRDYVQFLGFISNVEKHYQKAVLIILPSYEEGTPNVILEAYLAKKLCLASNIIMNKDISLDDRILFEADNYEQLAEKIEWIQSLSANDVERLKEKNYSFVKSNYDITRMQKRYQEIFMKGT